jgi:mitochondrial fission protein ELM1
LSGDNVLPITGSPHRVTRQRLEAEYEKFKARIDPLPHPRVAVLLGGKSKAFDLSVERAAQTPTRSSCRWSRRAAACC